MLNGESLLPPPFVAEVTVDRKESFKKNLKDFPCLKRDIETKKNQPFM